MGNNLQWVAYFDNTTKGWSLYDRSGTFRLADLPAFQKPGSLSDMSPLTSLSAGQAYWFFVSQDAEVEIGGNSYSLKKGASLIPWK